MATASTLTPSSSTAGTPIVPPARQRSPSPAAAALRTTAVNNAAAAARCPPNDPNLRTPVSSTYPSSLHSPRPGPATPILKGPTDPEKTPLTPPSAYLDFLRVLSPNPYTHSPLSTGTSTHFSYSASSPRWPSSAALSAKSLSPGPRAFPISRAFGDGRPAASPRPSSAVSSAAMSAAVGASPQRETVSAPPATGSRTAPRANSGRSLTRPSDLKFASGGRLPPNNLQSVPSPTGVPRPQSARLGPPPKRPSLVIPPSPSSSVTSMSPSQHSAPARSAYPSSAHPSSAHPDKLEKLAEPSSAVSARGRSPLSACVQSATEGSTSSPVTVRHVVTRTVTYRRPAGGSAASATTNISASVAPAPSPARRQQRTRLQSPLSAVEAVSDDDEDDGKQDQRRLIGDVPKGKRRKVE